MGLAKGLLWGFNANVNATYGGAKYKSNGVPDTNADGLKNRCTDRSTDFSNIQKGELLWMSGHVGIYIGDGLGVECTPSWKDGVQITAVANIGKKSGFYSRKWTSHGKLPYVEYVPEPTPEPTPVPETISVGDIVSFTGVKCYSNANKADDKYAVAKPGRAIVVQIYRLGKSKHPYRLKSAGGDDSAKVSGWCNEADVHAIPMTPPSEDDMPYAPKVGENIKFVGTKQFTNANQAKAKGKTAIPCVAKINRIYRLGKSKHPYNAHGTGVKGWINADDIRKL